jgi:NIPSNAP
VQSAVGGSHDPCGIGRVVKLEPIFIVDTLEVTPSNRLALLALLHNEGIPILKKAGLELAGFLSTSSALGEDVLIQVTWKAADHEAFNLIRKEFVTDPRWWTYSAALSQLRLRGTRRFFYPAPAAE